MRFLAMLIMLLVGFGAGALPAPVSASPCPHHAQTTPAVPQEARAERAPVASAPEIVVFAAPEAIDDGFVHPVSDHAIPEGQSCCHAAPAAAQAAGVIVAPEHGAAGQLFLLGSVPPWASPTPDIYRPPAFA